MNLTDACRLRSNELTRILAGAVFINPTAVLPMIDKLRPEALTDEAAIRFILAMREKFTELQAADNDHQATIMIVWAVENHLLIDLGIWMNDIENSITDAENAIRELQSLAIAFHELEALQGWIKDAEELAAWH
jgi:hypothetical protein